MPIQREISTHRGASGVDRALTIQVLDAPGDGGANHIYRVLATSGTYNEVLCTIRFQKGGAQDAGINGITNEALLAIVLDRISCFQQGPYNCPENEVARAKIGDALHWLHERTRKRAERGVEGTNVI